MNHKNVLIILISLFLTLSLIGCAPTEEPSPETTIQPGSSVLQNAFHVVNLLKDQNMEELSVFVHPDTGVRFSPYGYIDILNHQTFTTSQIPGLLTDTQTYLWGFFDGTGDPIQLTFEDYYEQFVYDVDFANPNLIGNNTVVGTGNSLLNISEVYPDAVFVEFHFTGFDPQYDGMDWESLRLVFLELDGIWYLSGIIHDQWTI